MQLVNRNFLNKFKTIIMQSHENIESNLNSEYTQPLASSSNAIQKLMKFIKEKFSKKKNKQESLVESRNKI